MTATMLGTLVEEGKLTWSTTVGEVFTELADKMDSGWKNITLEQLLTHRSGAPADLNADNLWARLWNHKGIPTEQRMTLVEGVLSKPPIAAPGTKYIYSNAGFAIAGAMAEKITGQSWEDLMRARLFEPLGMTSAGFGAPGSAEKIDQPRGHRVDGTAILPGFGADNPAAIGPAGTVHCSIGDWAKYIALHLNAERGECNILKRETFEKLHTPFPAGDADIYAMGWAVTNRDWAKLNASDGRLLTHAGSNNMWYCVAWLAPAPGKDFAVLVMCNQGGDDAAKMCDEIASSLIQNHVGQKK
jgi:CubicO group peptidase (beta-lactamase class C family)